MPDTLCEYCAGLIPLEWERCPHCARPGLYPNIKAAADSGAFLLVLESKE